MRIVPLMAKAASATPASRAELKANLLNLIKGLDRGLKATDGDRAAIDQACVSLERVNPNPASLASPLINGQWRLMYTTSDSILGKTKPALARPSGPIFQYIDTTKMAALNSERAPFFNSVSAALTATSQSAVDVQFTYFKIFGLIPVKAPPSAKGALDTTYLDTDLRISRGDKGNLFILLLEKEGCLL